MSIVAARLARFERECRALRGQSTESRATGSLEEFELQYSTLPKTGRKRQPATFLQIIDRSRYERYYSKLLAYFLDPNQAHGFGTACLNAILSCLELGEAVEDHAADRVAVFTELMIGRRPADVVVDTGELAVIFENKVDSGEGHKQTHDLYQYSSDRDFLSGRVKKHVYLTPYGAKAASSNFTSMSFRQLVGALGPVAHCRPTTSSAESRMQLSDFLRNIREEFVPDNKRVAFGAKSQLYLKHFDAIHDVQEAFNQDWTDFMRTWPERFRADCGLREGEWVVEARRSDVWQVYRRGNWGKQGSAVWAHFELWVDEETIAEGIVTAMLDVEGSKGRRCLEILTQGAAKKLCKKPGMVFRPSERKAALYWKDYPLKGLSRLHQTTVSAFKEFCPLVPLIDRAIAQTKRKSH